MRPLVFFREWIWKLTYVTNNVWKSNWKFLVRDYFKTLRNLCESDCIRRLFSFVLFCSCWLSADSGSLYLFLVPVCCIVVVSFLKIWLHVNTFERLNILKFVSGPNNKQNIMQKGILCQRVFIPDIMQQNGHCSLNFLTAATSGWFLPNVCGLTSINRYIIKLDHICHVSRAIFFFFSNF